METISALQDTTELPEAVVMLVAAYLADFETGRRTGLLDDGRTWWDVRERDEITDMACFATTCRKAHELLAFELQDEREAYEKYKEDDISETGSMWCDSDSESEWSDPERLWGCM